MFQPFARAFAVLLLPLVLAGCLLTPGKFTSTLTVNADRSFAFAYQGEVIAFDLGRDLADGMKSKGDDSDDKKPISTASLILAQDGGKNGGDKTAAAKKEEFDRKCRAIAAALAKEAGYRKAEYLGDGKFMIDYAIKGVLTHNFVYPYNVDAEAIFPFIALELRADGKVRMKAPAFAKDAAKSGPAAGMGEMGSNAKLDGTFTLDTDAEVVMQNNEAGVTTVGGRKRITWTVTPLSREAPMAVLGFK